MTMWCYNVVGYTPICNDNIQYELQFVSQWKMAAVLEPLVTYVGNLEETPVSWLQAGSVHCGYLDGGARG